MVSGRQFRLPQQQRSTMAAAGRNELWGTSRPESALTVMMLFLVCCHTGPSRRIPFDVTFLDPCCNRPHVRACKRFNNLAKVGSGPACHFSSFLLCFAVVHAGKGCIIVDACARMTRQHQPRCRTSHNAQASMRQPRSKSDDSSQVVARRIQLSLPANLAQFQYHNSPLVVKCMTNRYLLHNALAKWQQSCAK